MRVIFLLVSIAFIFSCKPKASVSSEEMNSSETVSEATTDFTIVFASCNDQDRPQPLWKPILKHAPDVFIWGGDNIYADTADMEKMQKDYNKVKSNPEYVALANTTEIIGTWDDHDYGKNDAGKEWEMKAPAQQLFLDFIEVPKSDPLRKQEGIYYSKKYTTAEGSVKVILLDTRTFRDALNRSPIKGRRYDPWPMGEGGTVLGATQWKWLKNELNDNTTDFTMIVSSIQFLADEHGWEKWGNHPSEVEKMKTLLQNAKANNIFIVSGDRHLAEISRIEVPGLSYPLIDFTTSGLTHTFPNSAAPANSYRVGNVIQDLNFGVLQFNFKKETVTFEIRGENDVEFVTYVQQF